MKKWRFSRRDVLKGTTALAAASTFASPIRAQAPAASRDRPEADRRRQEGRQGRLVHRRRPAGRGKGRQGLRGEISRHRRARRAQRRRARVPAHRPGIFQQHPRRRRRELVGRRAFHRLEARRHPGALRAGGRGQALPRRAQGSGRHVRQLPLLGLRDRLQHQHGEEGRGAQELRGSARPEMVRQDGQGASGLQRHHHDRDLPDHPRPRLGLSRASWPSRRSCRCSPRPIRPRSSRSANAP